MKKSLIFWIILLGCLAFFLVGWGFCISSDFYNSGESVSVYPPKSEVLVYKPLFLEKYKQHPPERIEGKYFFYEEPEVFEKRDYDTLFIAGIDKQALYLAGTTKEDGNFRFYTYKYISSPNSFSRITAECEIRNIGKNEITILFRENITVHIVILVILTLLWLFVAFVVYFYYKITSGAAERCKSKERYWKKIG